MRITRSLLILFLFTTHFALSQTTREERKAIRVEKRIKKIERRDSISRIPVKSYVSLSLVSPITPFPRINVGYTRSLNTHWSVGGSVGVGFQGLPFTSEESENYRLFEIRPEVLYFIGKGEKYTNYIGLELFYINSKETLLFDTFEPVNDLNGTVTQVSYERADYQRVKNGFLVNFGEYTRLSNKLMLRVNFGLGIRFKDNRYSDIQNPTFNRFDFEDNFFFGDTDPKRIEGFTTGVEFNMDFRLIYKLD
ncbi:hypothetical protein [Dokdonia sp. LLG6352-1]|uniref:hypothetical protein n=1 Tax=Dokdonia sp. LLG6352-1 TaxID=3160831 RepID=UPI0038633A0D